MLVGLVEGLETVIELICNLLLALLPDSPFSFVPVQWGSFGAFIGAVFPISTIVVHFLSLLVCILVYYALRTGLRFAKAIR